MTGKRLALFFLLIVGMEFLFFGVEASPFWRRRRRRRRYTPPPPPPPPPCSSSLPRLTVGGQVKNWANKWQQSFRAYCPYSYSMHWWISAFRKCQQDRIHHFRCRLGPAIYGPSDCNWTPHVLNDVKHSFFYKCPHNGFINGVISYFNKASKDRRIGVRCCHVNGYKHLNCKTTPYKNLFGGLLNYKALAGYHVVGVGSYHSVASSASFSDRRWMFEICQVKLLQGKK